MNKSIIRYLTVGWIWTMAWMSLGQAVLAGEPEPGLPITVFVYNWAQVEPNTLQEAKEVVTHILRKAGVEATLLDGPLSPEEEAGTVVPRRRSSNFFAQILSGSMAVSYGLPTQVLGIAPGTPQELNRNQVYVSDPVAERMAREQVTARENRTVFLNASKGQILGHAMAHEIGHVLLLQDSHAPTGLMRAGWGRQDLQNAERRTWSRAICCLRPNRRNESGRRSFSEPSNDASGGCRAEIARADARARARRKPLSGRPRFGTVHGKPGQSGSVP